MSSDSQLNPSPIFIRTSFPIRHLLLLAIAGAVLFFAGLGRLPLLEPDEGRNAEVAREMLATGDWITPHFNTLVYLDKPVVFFWMVATSFRLAGINEWAARLPSAVMALATMALVCFLARRMFGDEVGWRAALIFATAPLVLAYSRVVIFDMTLAFLVTVAIVSYWQALTSDFQRPVFDLLFFVALGLAAITKGPVGFLLPILTVLAFQVVVGRLGGPKRFRWGTGLIIFLAVALPWFVAVCIRHPDFLRYALWQESLRRFATTSTRRSGNFLYYLPVYLAGYFPWSFFLLYAGLARLRLWRELRVPSQRSVAFLVSWVAVIFIFFTISQSKLPGYFLPAIVPLSILTAKVWTGIATSERGSLWWLRAGFLTMLVSGFIIAATPQVFRLQSVEVAVTEKVPPSVLALIKPSLLYSGLMLAALGIVGRNLARRWAGQRLAASSLVLLALTVPLLLIRWRGTITTYANASSARRLAQLIEQSPNKDLPICGFYCFRTSLVFYLRRPLWLVTQDGSEMTSNYISSNLARMRREGMEREQQSGAEPVLYDPLDLRSHALYVRRPLLVLVRNRDSQKLSQVVPDMEPLWNDWEYSVWKIPATPQGIADSK